MTASSPVPPESNISTPAATIAAELEGVAVKSLQDVREVIDPRLSISSRPDCEHIDDTYGEQLREQFHELVHPHHHDKPGSDTTVGKSGDEPIYVEFEDGDERNPVNFSRRKKWLITIWACISTTTVSSAAAAYNMGFPSMIEELNCTRFQATLGLSVYALGFGIVPLVTASLSEEFGRRPLYIYTGIGFLLMHMTVALAKNIQTVIIARFLQGAFGSTGATMVGGTIADIWVTKERGLPMSIFSVAALGGTGLGPLMAGWVELNPRLGWRWIQWIEMIICSVYLVMVPVIMVETRSSILLMRIAKKLRQETGDKRYRARVEDERDSLKNLIFISCTRPIWLLCSEPVVLSFSLWFGFAWGIVYCLIESIADLFTTLHHFNIGEIGSVFTTMTIGSLIGFFLNMYQEKLYQKNFHKHGPEARLYIACVGAVMLPAGMFIYAWSSFPHIHWMAQYIGILVFFFAAFVIYLAVFSYLADCYGPYASSALAGQSLLRNIMATIFPLFTDKMFENLGYRWANTMFGIIACVMIPIPVVLFLYGKKIRRLSKFSNLVLEAEAAALAAAEEKRQAMVSAEEEAEAEAEAAAQDEKKDRKSRV